MNMNVKPAPGRVVRMHDRGFMEMPAEGTLVAVDAVYRKAILCGDLVSGDAPFQPQAEMQFTPPADTPTYQAPESKVALSVEPAEPPSASPHYYQGHHKKGSR